MTITVCLDGTRVKIAYLPSRKVATSARGTMSWHGHDEAARALQVWPLDEHNIATLDAVRPRGWEDPPPAVEYDLIAIGAGAGGLVSAKQSGRRGARSAMISEHLAGGDCLNVGCVPSKALLRCARAIKEVRRAAEFGVVISGPPPAVDFGAIMSRMRRLRAAIAPADAHSASAAAGVDVFQGRGRFTGPNTGEVNGTTLRFKKAVVATGGRVLNVTAMGPSVREAAHKAYEIIGEVRWDNGFWRSDIGHRAIMVEDR